MTALMTVAEIAVRLAAGRRAAGQWFHKGEVIEEAEALHAELVARGHIAPEPAPVAGPDWRGWLVEKALSGIPEWVRWIAINPDGNVVGFENYPSPRRDEWWADYGKSKGIWTTAPTADWFESLQRRPGGG